ncbi:hypothetical protein [Cryptosporangium phraense]|uniref:Uncharacterized protein n=1 Tax=Cryptosporangium phraense TaxID=2593070 RepID=A0A545AUX3_9ACTN|nr:hypothetical protein [Cryptosporangium phraense]TQS45139.1 hypothetical protein FL583_11640 [Cryptosporangium phraense]
MDDVEAVLAKHRVTASAAIPSPAYLCFTRLRFSGTKVLTGVTADGIKVERDAVTRVPFNFDWTLSTGLHGIGSDENLRGKSSTIKVFMWALRGRCDLKNEVRQWIDHVEAELVIDTVAYQVMFDVDHARNHAPTGTLTRVKPGDAALTVGVFEDDDQFEEVMGSAMMAALRLPPIAGQQEGRRTQHTWPTYAGALLVRGDNLQFLLGDVQWAGLPSRLLSLFVGSEWAAARAEAKTALTVAEAELARLESAASQHASAMSVAHAEALRALEAARTRVELLSATTVDISAVTRAVSRLSELNTQMANTSRLLRAAQATLTLASSQYTEEMKRRLRDQEDAQAIRFFQKLRPTVCPRCATPVTAERFAEESAGHSCSVCTTDLASDAHTSHLVEGDSALHPEQTEPGPVAGRGELDDAAELDEPVNSVEALITARNNAQAETRRLQGQLTAVETEIASLSAELDANQAAQAAVAERRDAELALARAQGAADALKPQAGPVGPDTAMMDAIRQDIEVLKAAEKLTADWVTRAQSTWLAELSEDVTTLAREFGFSNLTRVEVNGGARMRVTQGGGTNNYGACERGEQLRLKLATAVALIRQGRSRGVGRHPGLLFVDSPGAEEVAEDDFDSMIEALHRAAEAADIQVFVGTRHTAELANLLGEDRCRLGHGTHFVW